MLQSAHLIPLNFAELHIDVMKKKRKKEKKKLMSLLFWISLRCSWIISDTGFLLLEHQCGSDCYVKCFDDTERKKGSTW